LRTFVAGGGIIVVARALPSDSEISYRFRAGVAGILLGGRKWEACEGWPDLNQQGSTLPQARDEMAIASYRILINVHGTHSWSLRKEARNMSEASQAMD